ncbi:MAG TPA: hypothetical protein VLU94_02415, partial [Candidatus Nitrosotalea sp.]|nr:hypothetical protein [Candidatus Nitrosotalea sp.]
QEAIIWSGAGFDTNKLSYSWSTDAKTLTCSYSGNLPANSQISWTLLPSFPPIIVGFEDQTGVSLSASPPPFGFFQTASGGGTTNNCSGNPATNGTFTVFSLLKTATYIQNSAGPSTPDNSSDSAFNFGATIVLSSNRTATSATLTVPGGSPQAMSSFGSFFFVFNSTNDLTKLDALSPPGNYTFAVTGAPNQTVTANLPTNTLPNAPHLSNYAADQTINAGANFTLQWDAFVGGRTNDTISLQVLDSLNTVLFEITNAAGCPSTLPGTATSVVIPANTMISNQTYTAQIMFSKYVSLDTNSYPGSAVFVLGQSTTAATIATGTGSVTPPPSMVLTNVVWLPGGQFQFEFATAPGTSYTVEYTADAGNPAGWTSLPATNAVGNTIQITDTPPPGTPLRIYRTRHN